MNDGNEKPSRQVIRKSSTERFIEKIKVDPVLGCWIWQGALFGSNKKEQQYAEFNADGYHTAHIWAYERFIGRIPEGMKCCHRCDNYHCVNPYHLFLGSQKENIQDAQQKGRMPNWQERGGECPSVLGMKKNGRHPFSKLNEDDVLNIRRLWDQGFSLNSLSEKYGVDTQTLRSVINRKTWKHVP